MDWTGSILGATRARLLVLLRRSQRSINDLAAALGITDNAVRTHVAAMQRDGMVRAAGVERATGGKPAQLYEITPEAEELFPKAYALVLSELLQLLEERKGRDDVTALLREIGRRAAASQKAASGDEEGRVRAAAGLLQGLGGDVEVERVDGGWRIRGFGCPLSAVVAGHEEVCLLAESMVGEITGLAVTECCDRGERPRCGFEVESRARAPDNAA
jgi:predicted ArsR family transcriptional regulator